MSWDEIQHKFTLSEMAMMNFSSHESVAGLGKDKARALPEPVSMEQFLDDGVGNPEAMGYSEYGTKRGPVETTPDEMTDMRKFTGKQLHAFFQKQGLFFPMIERKKKGN